VNRKRTKQNRKEAFIKIITKYNTMSLFSILVKSTLIFQVIKKQQKIKKREGTDDVNRTEERTNKENEKKKKKKKKL
jgi:vacuolar-type H+-ATPase subunit I/STV1